MVILGGIGTLWGSLVGAGLVVRLEDMLATAGFDGIGIITGGLFVIIVLVFRRGLWGTARDLSRRHRGRHLTAGEPMAAGRTVPSNQEKGLAELDSAAPTGH